MSAKQPTITLKPGQYRVTRRGRRQQARQEAPPQSTSDWYQRWRERIHRWVATRTDETLASILMLVPDLLVLVVRLAKDPRVPISLKGQLALAAAYVLSPLDLLPEGVLGVIGLADDAGVLALVLYWLKSLGQVDINVLRENWPGRGEVDEVIDYVHDQVSSNRERIMSNTIWQRIERMFGPRGAQAKVKARSAGRHHRASWLRVLVR